MMLTNQLTAQVYNFKSKQACITETNDCNWKDYKSLFVVDLNNRNVVMETNSMTFIYDIYNYTINDDTSIVFDLVNRTDDNDTIKMCVNITESFIALNTNPLMIFNIDSYNKKD